MLNKLKSLNWLTIGKALLKAVIAAVLAYVLSQLKAGANFGLSQVQSIFAIALGTVFSYFVKHVLTAGAPNGSGTGSLNATDIAFACVQTVLNTVFLALIPILTTGAFPTGTVLAGVIKGGLITGVTYLATNFFSNTLPAAAPAPKAAATPTKN